MNRSFDEVAALLRIPYATRYERRRLRLATDDAELHRNRVRPTRHILLRRRPRWQRGGTIIKGAEPMNILLWVLQVALALQSFAGGAYKVFMFDNLANMPVMGTLPRGAWAVVGAFEMLCAVLLVVPAAAKWKPILTPAAATALALESLGLAVLYARYSLEVTASNPLVYVVVSGLLAAFVAYGRFVLRPVATR
jgi:hypothetical protein